MVRQFVTQNAGEREKLSKLVNGMAEEESTLTLDVEGWTVEVALAHLAFWDERSGRRTSEAS